MAYVTYVLVVVLHISFMSEPPIYRLDGLSKQECLSRMRMMTLQRHPWVKHVECEIAGQRT